MGTGHQATVRSRPQRILSTPTCVGSSSDQDVLGTGDKEGTGSRESGYGDDIRNSFFFFFFFFSETLSFLSMPSLQIIPFPCQLFPLQPWETKAISFTRWSLFSMAVPGQVNSGFLSSPPDDASFASENHPPTDNLKNLQKCLGFTWNAIPQRCLPPLSTTFTFFNSHSISSYLLSWK